MSRSVGAWVCSQVRVVCPPRKIATQLRRCAPGSSARVVCPRAGAHAWCVPRRTALAGAQGSGSPKARVVCPQTDGGWNWPLRFGSFSAFLGLDE